MDPVVTSEQLIEDMARLVRNQRFLMYELRNAGPEQRPSLVGALQKRQLELADAIYNFKQLHGIKL